LDASELRHGHPRLCGAYWLAMNLSQQLELGSRRPAAGSHRVSFSGRGHHAVAAALFTTPA